MMIDPESRQRIEHALVSAATLRSVSDALRKDAGPPETDPIWVIIDAFAYSHADPREDDRRREWGAFAPQMQFQDGTTSPQVLANVPAGTLDTWAEEAERLTHPAARARLHDLLWERRFKPRPDLHACAAIDAYVELSMVPGWRAHERAEGLDRALEIALRLKDTTRQTTAIQQTLTLAADWLAPDQPQPPGVMLVLLQSLARLPEDLRPDELLGLLRTGRDRYQDSPWICNTISDIEADLVRSVPDQVAQVRRWQISMWRELARKDDSPFRTMYFLQIALELARLHGLSDLLEGLRREFQEVRIAEESFAPISVKVQIPKEETDAIVNGLLAPEDWRECLLLFGACGPPSGLLSANLEAVERQATQFPLGMLFPKVQFSEQGIPIRTSADPEEHRNAALVDHEVMGINIFRGITGRRFLDEFRTRKGLPSHAELTAHFTTELISPERAERIARAFVLFWEEQYDEAAHILVPRLEAIIRDLCRKSGYSVVLEPIDGRPGGVLPLGGIMAKLREAIKGDAWPSWWRYLRTTLVDPLGLNMRNRISHGLIDNIESPDVVVLLHIGCALRLLELQDREQPANGQQTGAGPDLPPPPIS